MRRFSVADLRLRRLGQAVCVDKFASLLWVAVTNNFLEAFEWLLPYTASKRTQSLQPWSS
jgi:hypothetical protein